MHKASDKMKMTQFTQCFTSVWEGRVEMTHRNAEVRFPSWSLGVLSCPQFYRLKNSEPPRSASHCMPDPDAADSSA